MEDTALIEVRRLDIAILLSDDGMAETLEKIETIAMAHVPDITTDQGRKDIASMAYRVARSKTAIVEVIDDSISEYKKRVSHGNGLKRTAKDFFDDLKGKVRQPLTDYETEQERIKAEEAAREKKKVENRVSELQKYNVVLPFFDVAAMTDEKHNAKLIFAQSASQAEQARLAQERQDREFEAGRIAAERADLEKLRKEQTEKELELRVEREKIEAERRKLEYAAEEQRREQERKAIEQRMAEEAKAKAEQDAKDKAEREAKEAKERAEAEAAETARQELLKPDKEKLILFADRLLNLHDGFVEQMPVKSNEALDVMDKARMDLESLTSWIKHEAENL